MVTPTRGSRNPVGALEYVLAVVLALDVGSPIRMALNASGISDILDFMALTKEDLLDICWSKDSPSIPGPLKLSVAERNKILAI